MKFYLLIICFLATLLSGCGDDATTTSGTTATTTSYIGAVSPEVSYFGISAEELKKGTNTYSWSITLSTAGTFVVTSGGGITINGTYTTLTSGFVKLTVTSASGTGAPSPGDTAYGLNLDGVVFLLEPTGSGEIIPMVATGSCPSADYNLNWVIASMDSDSDLTRCQTSAASDDIGLDIIGTASFDVSENTISLPTTYDICANNMTCSNLNGDYSLCAARGGCTWTSTGGSSTDDTGTCANSDGDNMTYSCSSGVATITTSGGDVGAYMYLTANGGAIVQTQPGSADGNTILAFPPDSISAASDLDGDYVGLVFIEDSSLSDTTVPVTVTISSSKMTVTQIDPDTGSASGSINGEIRINSSLNSPSTGFFHGVLDVDGVSAEAVHAYVQCTVDLNTVSTTKNIINCIGQQPDGSTTISDVKDGSDDMFSLMIIEK